MMGARPLAFASTIVVEEGFPIRTLRRLLESIDGVMQEVGAPLIAGDIKVVERGSLDEIVASTTGIGLADSVVTDSGLKAGEAREGSGRVVLETLTGGLRIVREPYGSPMPRVC